SQSISPNSNTMIIFTSPLSVSNVRISIQDRGYSDDAGNVGYYYQQEQNSPLKYSVSEILDIMESDRSLIDKPIIIHGFIAGGYNGHKVANALDPFLSAFGD